jgi:hypothetical protein
LKNKYLYILLHHAFKHYRNFQCRTSKVSPFGEELVMVETGPFCSGLLALGQVPAKEDTLALYGEQASDLPERS